MAAGLIGRSESWLSQVERGVRRIDSHAVLLRLPAVLRVEVEELTGPRSGGEEGQRVYEPIAQIEQAMMCYDAVGASIGRQQAGSHGSPEHLGTMARTAYRSYQATRYEDTGRMMPAAALEPGIRLPDPDSLSVYGALHLAAAFRAAFAAYRAELDVLPPPAERDTWQQAQANAACQRLESQSQDRKIKIKVKVKIKVKTTGGTDGCKGRGLNQAMVQTPAKHASQTIAGKDDCKTRGVDPTWCRRLQ